MSTHSTDFTDSAGDTNNNNNDKESQATPKRKAAFAALGALGAVGLLGGGGVLAYAGMRPVNQEKIAEGVHLVGVPFTVNGLTKEEATTKFRSWAKDQMAQPITFNAPVSKKKWVRTLAEVGGRYDVDKTVEELWKVGKDDGLIQKVSLLVQERNVSVKPVFLFNEASLDKVLKEMGKTIDRKPENAKAEMEGKVLKVAKEDVKGLEIDQKATKEALLQGDPSRLQDGEEVTLMIKETSAKVTVDKLGKIGSLLGSFATDYGGSPYGRKQNVRIAARKINGTMLAPGDVFSYNNTVGERSEDNGFKIAHQYQDGKVVDAVGGGVCQPSSTLYNAVLYAGLKIVERSNHSMPVRYVSPGRDATVSYDSTDFRFENNTAGVIFIGASADGETLRFRLFGEKPLERKVVDIDTGSRHYDSKGGFSISTWRVFKEPNGKTTRELLGSSHYRAPAVSSSSSSTTSSSTPRRSRKRR
jgi:vancomycin resistance protein YoaR